MSSTNSEYPPRLPDIHRDPFDRILIAQALCEPLRLLRELCLGIMNIYRFHMTSPIDLV